MRKTILDFHKAFQEQYEEYKNDKDEEIKWWANFCVNEPIKARMHAILERESHNRWLDYKIEEATEAGLNKIHGIAVKALMKIRRMNAEEIAILKNELKELREND